MRRALTSEEVEYAKRLKVIWNRKKKQLNLTQEKLGLLCGWSGQSAVNQFLNGYTPLNTDAVLRLSKVLDVDPSEIMPEIKQWLPYNKSHDIPLEHQKIFEMLNRLTSEQRKNQIELIESICNQNELVIKELSAKVS